MSWTAVAVDWHLYASEPLAEGIEAVTAMGDQLSATRFTLDSAAVVPEHVHDAEEFGHVLSGSLRLTADGRTWTVGPGEGFLIRGGVPHSAVAADAGCDLLECYSPPRSPVPPNPTTAPSSSEPPSRSEGER